MATQTIARPMGGPAGSIRQRRDAARPSIGRQTTRAGTAEATETTKRDIPVPYVRTADYILKKFADEPPSLVVHLHPTHFRFEQQDGNFSYSSPMRIFLTHLKQQTVPHEMLDELFQCDVPFYDGCLIVHIYDHKTGATPSQSASSTMTGGSKSAPYSIHNWNEHVTPSPYVPFPTQTDVKAQAQNIKKEGDVAIETKESDKENMPAPNQPASSNQRQKKEARVMKTVLFPTGQSLHEEIGMLLRTPYEEGRDKKKQSGSGTLPPTPLTSVPPTPLLPKGPSAKRQKMCLDSSNVHEWEAEVINRTAPPLFLDPAKDTEHMLSIMDFMNDPTQPKTTAVPQKRKRTTAELAADEAQAAEEERFMLIQDERIQPTSASNAAGSGGTGADGQSGASKFEPTFSSFKTLENIKMRHEEMERQKKEEEHRQNMLKNQQKEAEQQRRKEEAERNAQQARMAQQRAQEDILKQQQAAAAQHAQNQAAQAQLIAQRNAQIQAAAAQQQHLQATSGPAMSPVVRNQTPMMASSPVLNGNPMMSQPMAGVPMSATSSNQGAGAGSPPRPLSAVSHNPAHIPMARQVSQQTHTGSAQGTPQMNQSTPMMQAQVPANRRNMTPQPRVNQQGSPMPGMNQPAPVMMNTPQVSQQMLASMTPQQRMQFMQMRGATMQQGSPQNMTPEQMQRQVLQLQNQQRAQQQMNQNGMTNMSGATNGFGQDYQARIEQQRAQQLQAQMRQNGQSMAASPSNNPVMTNMQQNGQVLQQPGQQGVPNLSSIPQQLLQRCRDEWQQRMTMEIQRARVSGQDGNVPQIQNRYRTQFNAFVLSRYKQFQAAQMQQRAANAGMPQQNMQQMNGLINGMQNGGQTDNAMYVQQLQQQQQRMLAAQQQQRAQAQAQAQMQAQMQQGMAGMGGFQGMSMQQMQQMQQMQGMGRGMQ